MNKNFPLQSLRGISCMIVVFVHFTPYEAFILNNHFLAGIAVICFYILSGYVLTLNYLSKITNSKNFFLFIKKDFLGFTLFTYYS